MAAGSWWVAPESYLGTALGELIHPSQLGETLYHVVQSRTKPSGPQGTVQGPYATKAQAQAVANSLNAQSAPQQAVSQATGGLSNTVQNLISGKNAGNLVTRGVEILAGLMLMYAGAKAMLTPAAVNVAAQPVKATGHRASSALKTVAKKAAEGATAA
jgi:hypothetical protein